MAKINTEYFIARRISSKLKASRRNVMVRIATATVAIGICVMIISLAVIRGFKNEITDKVIGFGGHVEIVNLDGNNSMETEAILKNPRLEEELYRIHNFKSLNTYAIKGGIVKTEQAVEGIVLKGVDGNFDGSFFAGTLVEGSMPVFGDSTRNRDILISQILAGTLGLSPGDRVEMLFLRNGTTPRRDLYRVAGIYRTGFEEMDKVTILTDLRNVQRLNGWSENQVSGYEVNTRDFSKLENFADEVYNAVLQTQSPTDSGLLVLDIKERFPNLFDWLAAHNVNAAVIITIMLLVSLLNMISALLIIVLERTRMIGILKSVGMNNRSLRKVFLYRCAFIIGKGLLWGNIIGIGLCLVQKYTHILKLNETGYFLSQVPISLELWWLLALNIGTVIILLGLLTIPTVTVSRIKPEKTIRFQ